MGLNRWKNFLGAIVCVAAAALPGCLADHDDSAGEDAAALAESDAKVAEGAASTCVDLVAGVVDEFPEWSSGDFIPSLARESSVTWNAVDQTWVIQSLEEYGEDHVSGVADFTIHVKFLVNGDPVQQPSESVNRMEVSLDGTNLGVYTAEKFTVEYDWTIGLELVVLRETSGEKTMAGSGTLTGSTVTEIGDRTFPRAQNLAWQTALTFPAASSCATGTLAGTLNDLALAATFQGEGTVEWSVSRAGVELASDTSEYSCGVYEPVW